MIRFPLMLQPCDTPQREAAGWFVAGPGPDAWLEEMSAWGVPLEKATLRLVPRAPGDVRPCGALVTLPAGLRPLTGPRAEPWACLGGRLWLPCRARLEPPVSEAEAGKLGGEAFALHPGVGLVAFGEGSLKRVAELLAPPEERPADWTKAQAGAPPRPRLLGVEPETPPRLEIILSQGRGDIGSRKPGELPPAPGEPGAMGQAAQWMNRKLAEAIDRLAKGAQPPGAAAGGGAAGGAGWLDRLRTWSAEKLQKWAAEIQKAREKEIRRLMHLLATDPDAGLKYAIPFGGGDGRGVAPPGASLGLRNTDFSLSRLGGGRPADSWSMDWKTQQDLIAKYRELAVRELRLGRHRRAAYIFAELLGDFRAAADALTEGRHFREAAVLYREKLKQPMQAAACLEKGGLLLEAIAIYDEEGQFETAGDLFAKIERPEDAAAMWRKAVKMHEDRGDALAAGRLLEGKLAAPEEALALYESTWPWSHQSGPCLDARFALMGRLGRHDAMRQLVARFLRENLPASRALLLARSLAGASGSYPDRPARQRAADAARVVAGRLLPTADAADAQELLRAVARTAPDDRLLARDVERFPRRHRRPAPPPPRPRETEWTPILAYQLQLPGGNGDITWETAAARRDLLYVAGFGGGGAVLARTPWSEAVQTLTWMPAFNYPHILEPGLDATRPVLFAGSPGPRLGLMTFPRTDAVPHVTPAGTPPWFPDEVLGAAVADLGTVWVVREHLDRLVAWAYTQQGAISAIYPLPQLEEALPEGESLRSFAPIPAVAQRLNLFAALGPRLARLGRDGAIATVDLTANVAALSASSVPDRPMVAAALEAGGALVFDGPDLSNVRRFAEDLAEPILTFTRDGRLIAAGEKEGRVFDTADGKVYEKATFPVLGGRPVAAVPGPKPNEFALVMPGGEVRVYRIPRK